MKKPAKRIAADHALTNHIENDPDRRTFEELAESVLDQLIMQGEMGPSALYKILGYDTFFGIGHRNDNRRRQSYYVLPKGFQDWDEWVRIVVSKLNAMSQLVVGDSQNLTESLEDSLKRLGMIGKFDDGIDKGFWMQIFSALQNGGTVSFSKALRFFQQIDDQRDNYRFKKTYPIPRRQFLMIENWIHLDSKKSPSLCRFDNASGALFLNYLEKQNDEDCDGISGQNFSREKAKLGLQSCKQRILKAELTRRGIQITDR